MVLIATYMRKVNTVGWLRHSITAVGFAEVLIEVWKIPVCTTVCTAMPCHSCSCHTLRLVG